jgi:hypothetical protein
MADMISLQIAQGIWRRQRRRQGTRRCSRLARIYFLRGLSLLCEETLTLLPLCPPDDHLLTDIDNARV